MITIEKKSKCYKNSRSNYFGGFKRMLSVDRHGSYVIVDQKDIVRNWKVHSRFGNDIRASIDEIAKDNAMDERFVPFPYRAYVPVKIPALYLEHKQDQPTIREIQYAGYIL